MPAWVVPAIAAATNLIGAGIASGKDSRQYKQQERLQNLQIRGQQQMAMFNQNLQKEMWETTGPQGQIEQYKKAGLNPALMYGMGGGGGQTIGNQQASVAGGMAPTGSGNEKETMMEIGLQMAQQMNLIKAQTSNINADTKLKETEANKLGGVDTKKAETEINSLNQGIENQKAQEQLTKAMTRMQNLANELQGRTMEDRIEMVNYETKRACQEAQQAVNNTNVSDATIQDRIKIIKREAINLLLEGTLTKAKTNLTIQNTLTDQTRRRALATEIEQGWQKVNNEAYKIEIDKKLREAGIDLEDRNAILRTITNIMGIGNGGAIITDQSYRPSEHHTHIQN